ncbi:hypothetical protein TNCV_3931901 [Trichonephila clavipes]|nr:hypothetical protein TNCV_3931901 [Trichonephila clavipes]
MRVAVPSTVALISSNDSTQNAIPSSSWESKSMHWYRIVACLVTSSSPVPLKTRRVGQRCVKSVEGLKRFPVGVVWRAVRRGGASSGCHPVT